MELRTNHVNGSALTERQDNSIIALQMYDSKRAATMSAVISVRVTEEERRLLDDAAEVFGCGVSTLIKQLAFERLEDEFDLRAVAEYEKEKEAGTLKTYSLEEVLRELGI